MYKAGLLARLVQAFDLIETSKPYGVGLVVDSGRVAVRPAAGVLSVVLPVAVSAAGGVVSPAGGVPTAPVVGVTLDGGFVGGTNGGGVGVGAWNVDGDIVAAVFALVNQS